jgi:Protein of unknown function (DUF1549)
LYDVVELRVGDPEEPGDETFLRRAYLDTTGILPSAEETAAFQADARPDKRAKLIDRLLSRPEAFAKFKDSAALKWSDVEHVLTLTAAAGGRKHLVVKDKSGGVVFEGPVDSAGDREKLPPDLAAKLLWMTRSLDPSAGNATPEAAADRSLRQTVPRFAVRETRLDATLQALGEQTGAKLVVNWKALKQAGVEPGEPITLELEQVRLSSLLKTILALAADDRARLGFTVEEEVIVISTAKPASD